MEPNFENQTEGQDYTEFVRARVMDTIGFPEPIEALSILTPKDWPFEGSDYLEPTGHSLCRKQPALESRLARRQV